MKILHLTTMPYGGAGISCLRLHSALLAAGVESHVLSVFKPKTKTEKLSSLEETHPEFLSLLKKAKRKKIRQALQVRFHGNPKELFSFPDAVWKIEEHPLVKSADIIHLHWVAGMIGIPEFFNAIKKPVVWTLHDAWPFSGGFHYTNYFDTVKYNSLSEKNTGIKSKAYTGKNISLISPSIYLAEECKKSKTFGSRNVSMIPYSIPAETFFPSEINKVKSAEKTWLFACDELDYYRKGAAILLEAFSGWKNENVKLIIAGKAGKIKIPSDNRIHLTGHIDDENKMAELLRTSDALIHTSREDNLPNIILESFFSGTPVLATPAGGIPEMITDGINGFLSEDLSVSALQRGFEKLAGSDFDRDKIAEDARLIYSENKQAAALIAVYNSL